MTARPRPTRLASLVLGGVLLLGTGGCGLDLQDVPMPSVVRGETYQIDAVFAHALNLPLQAPVKLGGRTVGQVAEIRAEDFTARVTLDVLDEIRLGPDARAEVRLTSPMGEAFVELIDAGGGRAEASAALAPGSVITDTGQAPDVNDLLSALSVVVHGGSFGDIGTIIRELNTALGGNAGNVRSLLRRAEDSLSSLNDHTAEFDRSLNGLDRLAGQLAADRDVISTAIRDLTPTVQAFARQHEDLMALLRQVRHLSRTAVPAIDRIDDDLVQALQDLGPVLDTLNANEKQLVPMLAGLEAFADGSDDATRGDYANFDLKLTLDPDDLAATPGAPDGEVRPPGYDPDPDAGQPLADVPILGDLVGSLLGLGGP